jgi:TetR/AcrR family transcriptional regulator, transcriptional repressor for nem operon
MSQTLKPGTRNRILDAAVRLVRTKGYNATSVEELCAAAGVSKGAFFHHFKGKEDLGAAAAGHWTDTTAPLFAEAPYHEPDSALDRVLAYVDYRCSLLQGALPEFTCLAGTLAQEVHTSHPAIAEAAGASITAHAMTLVDDIGKAMDESGGSYDFTAESLALHTQAVLQGAFILAKAKNNQGVAKDSLDHLRRYVEMLFRQPNP